MDAMTMPFRVAHPSVVEGLAPGDSITFVFATGRDGVEIRSVDTGRTD
jgi:Cu/Ag efflux protein CusF